MARPAKRPHELRLRNRQGKAVCSYQDVEYRFGKWDLKLDAPTPEAVSAFQRQVGLWTINPNASAVNKDSPTLFSMWNEWLRSPQAPRVADHILDMCVSQLFGSIAEPKSHRGTLIASFTSADLLAWQTQLCETRNDRNELRYGRATVAKLVALVRRCFDWGVTVGKVSADQYAGIERVKPPARGQVKEPVRRQSVSFDVVEATVKRIDSAVADLLLCMWWTGARPGELCVIDVGMVRQGGVIRSQLKADVSVDLDQYGVWAVNLGDKHKTAHHGKERVIFFGPRAQEVIRPLLAKDRDRPLFETETGKPYTAPRVYTCTVKAAKRAGMGEWFPYQIDHSFLSRVMVAFSTEIAGTGLMAARAARGHSLRGVTEIYTGGDWITAAKVAQRCG